MFLSTGLSVAKNIRVDFNEKEEILFSNLLKNQVEREVSTGNPRLYFLKDMNDYNYVNAIDLYDVFEENSLKSEVLIDSTSSIIISGNLESISSTNSPLYSYRDQKIAELNMDVSKDYNYRPPIKLLMINKEFIEKAIKLKKGDYISIICMSNSNQINNISRQITFKNCRDIETCAEQYGAGTSRLVKHALNLYFHENQAPISSEDLEHNNMVINNILTRPLAIYTAQFIYFINKYEDIATEKNEVINEKWGRLFIDGDEDFKVFLKKLNLPNSL